MLEPKILLFVKLTEWENCFQTIIWHQVGGLRLSISLYSLSHSKEEEGALLKFCEDTVG